MRLESSLDIAYRVNPRIASSIRTSDSVTIRGAGEPFELSLALFQLLLVFAEPKTVRQAFDSLDVDVDLDEFGGIVDDLVDRGLLHGEPAVDDAHGLQQLLSPRVFSDPAMVDRLGTWLRQGRAIVIPDALPQDFAEDVHRDLSRSTRWSVVEGGHDFFHFRTSTITELEGQTPALTECSRVFGSPATRRFVADLSGHDCSGKPHVTAAWYRPGEYALPHDDTGIKGRSVACVWYLTKDWRQEWGGAFFWCPTGQYLLPRFNTLVLFNVRPSSVHLVCPVAPTATSRRIAINGFWSRSDPCPQPTPVDPSAVVSPRAYGHAVADDPGSLPIAVL
jgi:hypothetical protein